MLTVEHRLRRTSDFRSTVRGGVRAGRRLVVVYLRPSPSGSDGPTRAGFVVGRTVGPAVVRNTVRRRLRHLLRDRLDRLPPGSRIVVRALPAAAAAPSSALGRDLDAAIERALSRLAGPS